MQKARKKLSHMQGETNVYTVFEAAGQAMLMSMGGASGVIFGSLYLAGAKDAEPKERILPEDLAVMERKSLAVIQERGKAKAGDKTMGGCTSVGSGSGDSGKLGVGSVSGF